MLFGQHDKTEAFFFLQDTDIVSSNLWTGNRVNIRPLQKGKNSGQYAARLDGIIRDKIRN